MMETMPRQMAPALYRLFHSELAFSEDEPGRRMIANV
jgi:hypothetical protein